MESERATFRHNVMAYVCAFRTASSVGPDSLERTVPTLCAARGCTGVFSKPPDTKQCGAYVPAPTNPDHRQFFKRIPLTDDAATTVSCIDRLNRTRSEISFGAVASAKRRVDHVLETAQAGGSAPALTFAALKY